MSAKAKYKKGNTVVLNKNREGVIRYVGSVKGHRGIFYGIELTKGTGDNNGRYESHRYFRCSNKKGKFVPEASIVSMKVPNCSIQNPPRKKRKVIVSSSSESTQSSSDHDQNQENDNKRNDDEYQIVALNSRKRKRTQRTYKRHIASNSVHKPQKYQIDPFETNDDEEEDDSLEKSYDEENDKNDTDYDNENQENIENIENMDDIHNSDGYILELESINKEIERFTVHKLKHYLKKLQSLINNDEEPIFTDCSLKGKKKDLIKRIKDKILLIYAKNLKNESNKSYSKHQFKEWKVNIKQFIADAKKLKSPKKSTDKIVIHKHLEHEDDDDDDHDVDKALDVSLNRRSTRLQCKSKAIYAETPSSERKRDHNDDDDDDNDTLNVDITLNGNKSTANDTMGINLDEVEDDNDTNDNGAMHKTNESMDTVKNDDDGILSMDMILKGLQNLKHQNEIEMNKKEMEIKENENKVTNLMNEINDWKDKYKVDIGVKDEKISKLTEKNKKRKQEIFVLKRKNQIMIKTIKENEELIQEKDGIIQEKEEENKILKKSEKENKQRNAKQQNEIVELKIYKELYDNDQDISLTQNVDDSL